MPLPFCLDGGAQCWRSSAPGRDRSLSQELRTVRIAMKSIKLWATLLVCMSVSTLAFADSSVKLSNNVPPWLAQATLVGPSDGKKQVAVAMYLQLSNVSG